MQFLLLSSTYFFFQDESTSSFFFFLGVSLHKLLVLGNLWTISRSLLILTSLLQPPRLCRGLQRGQHLLQRNWVVYLLHQKSLGKFSFFVAGFLAPMESWMLSLCCHATSVILCGHSTFSWAPAPFCILSLSCLYPQQPEKGRLLVYGSRSRKCYHWPMQSTLTRGFSHPLPP